MSNYRWIDGVITYTPKIRDVEDYLIDNIGRKMTAHEIMEACNASQHDFLIAWRNATRWEGYRASRTEDRSVTRGRKMTYLLEVVKLPQGENKK